MNVLVFPGNPPIKSYYEDWISELSNNLPNLNFEFVPYGMSEESNSFEYLKNITNSIIKSQKDSGPLILIGHSIGAYFAMKLYEQFENRVCHCFLICPFLGEPNLRGRLLLELGKNIHDNSALNKLFFKNITLIKKFVPELRPANMSELTSGVRLARHERDSLLREKNLCHFKPHHSSNITIYHSPKDNWFPEKKIKQASKNIECIKVPIKHDFIVNESQRLMMAKLISSHILNIFGN